MSNKLLEDAPQRRGTVTVDMLHQLASDLNAKRFVIDSGKPYFVNRMANGDGTLTNFLDR